MKEMYSDTSTTLTFYRIMLVVCNKAKLLGTNSECSNSVSVNSCCYNSDFARNSYDDEAEIVVETLFKT